MNRSIEATPFHFLRLQKKLRIAAITSAVIILFFSLIILSGFLFNNLSLIRFPFSASGMNPMVAASFLLGSTSLIAFFTFRNAQTMVFMKVVGWFFILEGLFRFTALAGIFDPKLDIILFPGRFIPNASGQIAGRMSYTSAFAFLLTGTAFLLKISGKDRQRMLQYILYLIIILALFAMISILYGVNDSYFGPLQILKMSLSTSCCFFFTALALLIERSDKGIMSVITSRKPGGSMARSFLPLMLILPILGVVDRFTESSGLLEDAFGLALVSIIAIVLFFIIIIRTARSSNNLYDQLTGEMEERKRAVQEASNADLFASIILNNIPNMVFVKDGEDLAFRSMNKAGEEMTGTSREEFVGKTDYDFFPREQADFFKARDREVFDTNKPVITEEPITTKHYGIRWLRTKKIGVRDESGKPLYMIGISEDITELKEKEKQLNSYYAELEEKVKERTQELLKSEKRFFAIIQNAPDAIVIADENETIQMVNTQTERLLGYTRTELIGQPIKMIIPERMIRIKNAVGQSDAGHELSAKTKNGRVIPVEISLGPVETTEGMLISVSIRDITQRKRAEKILVENELMFRDLTQNVPGVIYQWIEKFDGGYGPIYVSPKMKQYFGFEPSEMHKIAEYIHPDDKERWRRSIDEANATETPWFFEGRLLYPDGHIKWWRGTAVMSVKNDEGRIYNGIMMDITDQKQIEEKILRNQKRYEAIFNSQYQLMGLMKPDGTTLEVNETALSFAGLHAADVIGKPFWECYWWAISERTRNQLKESISRAATGEFIRYETDILGKNGIIASIDFSIKPVRDDQGKVILLITEGRDITQRKLLEQKAKEQEEQIRLFIKHSPAAVAMFDNHMRYMIASDRWYTDYGLNGTNIIGRSHYEIFPEIQKNKQWKEIHNRCLEGSVEIREQDPFVRADGSIDWLKWEIHPWRTNNDRIGGIIMFTEVITDKIKAQENLKLLNNQLTESNRELEQFAYVASHDLQEPLRMVSSFLQLLDKKYKAQLDDNARQYIHFAVDGSERMKVLINDLLKFSRVGTAAEDPVEIDCNAVITNLVQIYSETIRETGATINAAELPVLLGNKTQVEQLFQNLIGNAIKYRGAESPVIEIGCEGDETHWKFHVKDNGIGIEPRFFEKVFVIFQRLHGKNEYSGTGIGLAICKKIVERHGGKIWIESKPGKGSTFYFTFPKSK